MFDNKNNMYIIKTEGDWYMFDIIEEEKKIEKLIEVTKSTEKLYSNLATLEIKNKKETTEFDKQLDYLSLALELEREIYNGLNLNASKSVDLYKYLKRSNKDSFLLREEELIVQSDYESLCFRRILNKLFPIVINGSTRDIGKVIGEIDSKIKEVSSPRELSELITSFKRRGYLVVPEVTKEGIACKIKVGLDYDIEHFFKENGFLDSDVVRSLTHSSKLKMLIERDFYFGYLNFLEEKIKKSKGELRKSFIISKYNTIFLKEELEEKYRLNRFNVDKNMFFSSECVATQIYDIDLTEYQLYKEELLNLMFYRHVTAMYTMDEDEFKSTLRNLMIKSIITLSEDKEELESQIYIYNKVQNKEEVFNLLSDSFDKAKKSSPIKLIIKR